MRSRGRRGARRARRPAGGRASPRPGSAARSSDGRPRTRGSRPRRGRLLSSTARSDGGAFFQVRVRRSRITTSSISKSCPGAVRAAVTSAIDGADSAMAPHAARMRPDGTPPTSISTASTRSTPPSSSTRSRTTGRCSRRGPCSRWRHRSLPGHPPRTDPADPSRTRTFSSRFVTGEAARGPVVELQEIVVAAGPTCRRC